MELRELLLGRSYVFVVLLELFIYYIKTATLRCCWAEFSRLLVFLLLLVVIVVAERAIHHGEGGRGHYRLGSWDE